MQDTCLLAEPGSFHVSATRHVTVTDNQMAINAMSAFTTKVRCVEV